MIRFEVDGDALLHSRFALSPLSELGSLMRKLNGSDRHRLPTEWLDRLRPAYRRLRADSGFRALLALHRMGYGATFIVPPPRGLAQTVQEDLAAVRATPLAQARLEIEFCLLERPMPDVEVLAVLQDSAVVELLAQALEKGWRELLAADWPQLRAICERDVLHRSGQLGRRGWAAALDELHPKVRWHDGGIELAHPRGNIRVDLRGQGLLLVPSVFVWPWVSSYTDDPWPKAMVYPARGVSALWETPAEREPGALADLLGRSRAKLLVALAEPATTTQLAAALGLAVGAVGDHLAVLHKAGLLDKARVGRSVVYRRTPLGAALAGTGS